MSGAGGGPGEDPDAEISAGRGLGGPDPEIIYIPPALGGDNKPDDNKPNDGERTEESGQGDDLDHEIIYIPPALGGDNKPDYDERERLGKSKRDPSEPEEPSWRPDNDERRG